MRKPSKSVTKRTKLEPLSVEEALSAPAVEGMFSFLNIRPEELLHYRQLSDVVRRATPLPPNPDTPRTTNDSKDEAIISSPGIEVNSGPGLEFDLSGKLLSASSPAVEVNSIPRPDSNPGPGLEITHSPGIGLYSSSGLDLSNRPGSELDSKAAITTLNYRITSVQPSHDNPDDHPLPISSSGHHSISSPGLEFNISPGPELTFQDQGGAANPNIPPPSSIPGEELNYSPGLEFYPSDSARSLLVSQVHYTIRRARLVQDGHTSNEQKLYEYLWTHGNAYDDVSRRLSIGFRTLAEKVRMARASAQKNLRALGQKLALEVIEGFDVTSSRAPTYRVFNYSEILRRREMAGMIWYVRRTQAVRFVDGKGQEIIRRAVATPGLVLVDSPGLAFDSSPGLILEPAPGPNITSRPGLEFGPPLREVEQKRKTIHITSSSHDLTLPTNFVEAFQEITPFIDNQALTTLWTECRTRAPDCTVEEILYFTQQKALVCQSGKIQHPVGFLLASVPKCFEGQPFQIFRREQARHQQETQTREAEERSRAQSLEQEAQREAESYRMAEERLATLSQAERETLYQQVRSELQTKYPRLQWPDQQALDDRIRLGMIRGLQRQFLGARQGTS